MAAKKKTVMKRPKAVEKQDPPRPMYFLAIRLENVRCFGPTQTLDLSDGKGRPARWTVILGNNGVGKTTLLQCLTAFEVVTPAPVPGAVPYLPRFQGMPGTLVPHVREHAQSAKLEAAITAKSPGQESSKEDTHFGMFSWGPQIPGWGPSMYQHWGLDEPFVGLICYGYGATRRMGAGALSAEKLRRNDSLFQEDVPLRNAEEWLLQSDYAAIKESPAQAQAKTRRDHALQVLKDLLPDIDDIRLMTSTSERPAAQVEFKTPYGWVGMQDLSLGYRTLIAWMVDLASRLFERYPDSANPLAEPAVVLVDEIDLHLHPKWQRRLIGYLNEHFPKAQFIVTAHSPLVVQSAMDANIVVLRQEGDHVVIDNDVASIRGWRVDQILTSDLFGLKSARPPQLDKLLAERTALLSKARLTSRDKARLKQLEIEIGPLPAGETQTEREALEVIQRFAEDIRKDSK